MNKCEYCSSTIGVRKGGGVHLWELAGVGWGWEDTVVYEMADEIVNLNSRQFDTFSNH